jgi:hypothetical protein
MASGLHHPLALALTLSRPFRLGGKENVTVSAAAEVQAALLGHGESNGAGQHRITAIGVNGG